MTNKSDSVLRRSLHKFALLPPDVKKFIRPLTPKRVRNWYVTAASDAYLLSFPKCGRTWFRLMLGKAMQSHFKLDASVDLLDVAFFASLDSRVPRVHISHDEGPQKKRPDQLETDKSKYRGTNVVLLVRDPRDVLVSNFFQETKREGSTHKDMSSYLRSDVGSIDTLLAWYNTWAENKDLPSQFSLLRYENLHKDAHSELRSTLAVLGMPDVDDDVIDEAVQYASFKNMRKLEEKESFQSDKMRAGDKNDQESFKTRKGKVGGFTDYLSKADIDYVEQKIQSQLSDYYSFYK
ncbi:MAG: sulfotransferase domain-containing protein [Pseudomonadota bacterium]